MRWRQVRGAALAVMAITAGVAPSGAAQAGPSGTVIVANMSGSSIWLVDAESGERRAEIATHAQPHEVAINSTGDIAAVTNYGQGGPGNLVQVIDVPTGEVLEEIEVDGYERLHGAALLSGDSLLALTSERTGEVLVVGLWDGDIRRKLSTEGQASHMLSMGGGWIYTANILSGTVSRIDPDGRTSTSAWPAGTRTEGIAATPDGREGWTGSMQGGTVTGVNGETGEVVAEIDGLSVPYRLAVTPDGGTVVVSDPEANELVLIDRATGTIAARVDIGAAARAEGLDGAPSPQGFTLSADGRWAFVAAKNIDRVVVVDLQRASVVRFLRAGAGPDGIGFTPVRAG